MSLEDSNRAVQITLTSGSSDLVIFLAAKFMPSTSTFQTHSIQICTVVQRLVYILWEQTLQALSAVSVNGMLSFRLARVLGDEPCLHQDAASLL